MKIVFIFVLFLGVCFLGYCVSSYNDIYEYVKSGGFPVENERSRDERDKIYSQSKENLKIIKAEKDPLKKVEKILEELSTSTDDSDIFLIPSMASGIEHEKDLLLSVEEVNFLVINKDISIPLMHKMLADKKVTLSIICVYFAVFGKAKSIESLPFLSEYLRRVPQIWGKYIGTCSDPFSYALAAIMEITGKNNEYVGNMPGYKQRLHAFNRRREIADETERWYKEHITSKKQ